MGIPIDWMKCPVSYSAWKQLHEAGNKLPGYRKYLLVETLKYLTDCPAAHVNMDAVNEFQKYNR